MAAHKNGSTVGICARCMHVFARLAPICYAQSVPIGKNFCIGAQEEVYQECVLGWEWVQVLGTKKSGTMRHLAKKK